MPYPLYCHAIRWPSLLVLAAAPCCGCGRSWRMRDSGSPFSRPKPLLRIDYHSAEDAAGAELVDPAAAGADGVEDKGVNRVRCVLPKDHRWRIAFDDLDLRARHLLHIACEVSYRFPQPDAILLPEPVHPVFENCLQFLVVVVAAWEVTNAGPSLP